MSKSRQLADLLDSNGDVNTGALDNVPPSNDASALTTGTLDSARLPTSGVSASSLTTGTLPVDRVPYIGRRNLIINGAMQVAQRGTSATSINSNQYTTVDRWTTNMNSGGGTWTVTQESSSGPDGFPNSAKVECTTATGALSSNEKARWEYRIEGQDVQHFKWGTSAAESITISFWVKSNKTGTYTWEINNYDGTNTNHICKQYTINSADTWEYKTLTVVGDTDVVTENVNGTRSQMYFHLVAGTDFQSGALATAWATSTNANRAVGNVNLGDTVGNYWQITGVQLEVGSVATPFEHRSYGEELALCQRYYKRYGAPNNATVSLMYGTGAAVNSHAGQVGLQHSPIMRAVPVIEHTGTASDYGIKSKNVLHVCTGVPQFTLVNFETTGLWFQSTGNLSSGDALHLLNNTTSGFVAFNAEL